ncbi:MAG: nitroreductase family protein [bacterium]
MSSLDVDTLLEALRGRRSIRRFAAEPLPPDAEEKLVTALRWAPSAGNAQPYHFVLVYDGETKRRITLAALSQSFIADAPLVVVACVDEGRAYQAYGKRGVLLYSLQDVAASLQNLLLTAHALGLGACWIGAFDEQAVGRLLALPEHVRPVALVPIGVPAETPAAPPRRPADEVTSTR